MCFKSFSKATETTIQVNVLEIDSHYAQDSHLVALITVTES